MNVGSLLDFTLKIFNHLSYVEYRFENNTYMFYIEKNLDDNNKRIEGNYNSWTYNTQSSYSVRKTHLEKNYDSRELT